MWSISFEDVKISIALIQTDKRLDHNKFVLLWWVKWHVLSFQQLKEYFLVLLSLPKEGWSLTELIFWLCPLPSLFSKRAPCLWTSKQIILSLFPATKGDSHMVGANGLTINVLDLYCQKGKNAMSETVTIKNNRHFFNYGYVNVWPCGLTGLT